MANSVTVTTEKAVLNLLSPSFLPNKGYAGWSPILAVVTDGTRKVLEVTDWTGGEGTKPTTGYVGADGIEADIADAVDLASGITIANGTITNVMVNASAAIEQSKILNLVSNLAAKAEATDLTSHTSNVSNPHGVTKAQVGLSAVDNTPDTGKPVSSAQQTALDLKADATDIPDIASQAEAEAGTENTKMMTPLRTAQAIADQAGTGDVSSVNGQTGAVVLDAGDIAEVTDKRYMTDAQETKLDGVASGATANATNAQLRDTDTHTDGTVNKVYTAVEKAKLAGISSGATQNSSDSQLRNTDTHTDGVTNKVFSATEKTKLAAIEAGAQVNPAVASEAEAYAGANNTKIMTPLRVAQAIAVFGDSSGGGASVSGQSLRRTVTQASHGFSAEQVVYDNNGTWALAKADAYATAKATGVIESVTDANTFVVVFEGEIAITLTANKQYYLSDATAGLLVVEGGEPTSETSFLVPVLQTSTTAKGYVDVGEPLSLGKIPITALADIDTDNTLSANSNNKIPTQRAVKEYTDSVAGGVPTGMIAMFSRAGIASLPSGWTECDGNNGTTDEADVGSQALVIKHGGTVATPELSSTLDTDGFTRNITLASDTSGVVIKYTTNGDTPSRSVGTTYSSPFSVGTSTTVKAIAYRTPSNPTLTMLDSAVLSELVAVTPIIPTAEITPTGDELILIGSEALEIGGGGSTGILLAMSGGAVTATYDRVNTAGNIVCTLSRVIDTDETPANGVTYTQPTNGIQASASGVDVASFADLTVDNQSLVADSSSSGGGGSTPAVIAVAHTGGSANTVTSAPFNCLGANTIVAICHIYGGDTSVPVPSTPTDTEGNTYILAHFEGTLGTFDPATYVFVAQNATPSAVLEVSFNKSFGYVAINLIALSNMATSSIVDQTAGTLYTNGGAGNFATVPVPSITTGQANTVAVAVMTAFNNPSSPISIDSGYGDLLGTPGSSGNYMGSGVAVKILTGVVTTSPTFTLATDDNKTSAVHVSLKY